MEGLNKGGRTYNHVIVTGIRNDLSLGGGGG